jgi:uncharacterized damage-inducible protein DinB
MKKYLLDFFNYNETANRKLLDSVKLLNDKSESIKLFSHFISSHNKWYNRITKETDDKNYSWFDPLYSIDELEKEWVKCINKWIVFIRKLSEEELEKEIIFERPADGKKIGVKILDIALQLNYHSIHHRAQINLIIRRQGIDPPVTDYIFTVLKEL